MLNSETHPGVLPPFHPQCRIIPQEKILARGVRLVNAGHQAAAVDLVHAMESALRFAKKVDRASIKLTLTALPTPASGGAS